MGVVNPPVERFANQPTALLEKNLQQMYISSEEKHRHSASNFLIRVSPYWKRGKDTRYARFFSRAGNHLAWNLRADVINRFGCRIDEWYESHGNASEVLIWCGSAGIVAFQVGWKERTSDCIVRAVPGNHACSHHPSWPLVGNWQTQTLPFVYEIHRIGMKLCLCNQCPVIEG